MPVYNEQVSQYITELFAKQDAIQQRVSEETTKKGLPAWGIQPEEGRFLQLLVRASGAIKALEIGTLGGYSGIWIARGLAPGGKLITVEKSAKHAEVAREHFAAADVDDRIDVWQGDARQLFAKLASAGPFDFIFIDADKENYIGYFDWALDNTRTGGIITAHNALRGGQVADPQANSEIVEVIRAFNRHVAAEPRAISSIYPAGDGTLVAIKIA